MRPVLALLALMLLTAAAPTRDWSVVATRTPSGTFVVGNPAARVKLVEYASYTCSHCAAFAKDSQPVLKDRMIRSGSTSLEVRHMIRDRLDLAAVVLARCGGPRMFVATSAAIFAAQDAWLDRGIAYDQANAATVQAYPLLAQLRAYADGSGLTALAKTRGLNDRAIAACFADTAEVDRIVAATGTIPASVKGTPTFFLNGKQVPNAATWAALEAPLRAAGAR